MKLICLLKATLEYQQQLVDYLVRKASEVILRLCLSELLHSDDHDILSFEVHSLRSLKEFQEKVLYNYILYIG